MLESTDVLVAVLLGEPEAGREPGLLSAPIDDEIVFLSPASDNYVAMDGIGRRVWDLLDAPKRPVDLADDLVREFDAPRDQIAADVLALLVDLEVEGIVRVVQDHPG